MPLSRPTCRASPPRPPPLTARAASTAKPRRNEPRFDIRRSLHQLIGIDLTQLDAIGPYSALRLLAEIGIDMSRWQRNISPRGSPLPPRTRSLAVACSAPGRSPLPTRPLRSCASPRWAWAAPRRPSAPFIGTSPTASARQGPSRRRRASWPSSSIAPSKTDWCTTIPGLRPMTRTIAHACSAGCASAPPPIGFTLVNLETGEQLEPVVS